MSCYGSLKIFIKLIDLLAMSLGEKSPDSDPVKKRAKERTRNVPTAHCRSAKVCRKNYSLPKKKSNVALRLLCVHVFALIDCFTKFPTELRNQNLPWIARRHPSHSAKREPFSSQRKIPWDPSPFQVSVRKLEKLEKKKKMRQMSNFALGPLSSISC